MKKVNLKGQRFGRLVVIEETSERDKGSVVWKCECDCGGVKKASAKNLKQQFVKSCGCLVHHTNSFKTKEMKEKLKPDNGRRCRRCGKNCYPNYFFCEDCHAIVSNDCWDE
jgi:hypothetical protein